MSGELTVEVVYALPAIQRLKQLTVPPGTTVQQAIELSGILQDFPEIDLAKNKVGVFGKLTRLDAPLRDRDRIEIYRPLLADPKEVRRRRAKDGPRRKTGI
ncbi:RnfH family protein [Pelomicrobium methylotrophicum]|uniref:UPF0125 protein FR698_11515 n=1 Tax=Pelomicrobium methylotrophicum TaxID=2602750 RepID=A0A5C7ETA4_9PROT|nr:RnfH family protein [Pelomicrobium methylotrophicum]TXF11139.1 RnfH family protein [Pelomicrobium methylotrophicum]